MPLLPLAMWIFGRCHQRQHFKLPPLQLWGCQEQVSPGKGMQGDKTWSLPPKQPHVPQLNSALVARSRFSALRVDHPPPWGRTEGTFPCERFCCRHPKLLKPCKKSSPPTPTAPRKNISSLLLHNKQLHRSPLTPRKLTLREKQVS